MLYAWASEWPAESERSRPDERVAAYREPWPARLGRWMRRHRTGTQAAAVILLAVTLVSVTSGQEMLTLKGQLGAVTSVAFSADGKRLASASVDGTVKVWDARPWTPEL